MCVVAIRKSRGVRVLIVPAHSAAFEPWTLEGVPMNSELFVSWLVVGWKEGQQIVRLAFGSHKRAFRCHDILVRHGWSVATKAVE